MKRIIALLLACIGMALPYLKSMEVMPTRADWSGWTYKDEPNNWVGTTFTANFDSICRCDVFIGHVGDTSHHYDVDVYEYPTSNNWVARKHDVAATRSSGHVWLRFDLETRTGQKFTRGKKYYVCAREPAKRQHQLLLD